MIYCGVEETTLLLVVHDYVCRHDGVRAGDEDRVSSELSIRQVSEIRFAGTGFFAYR
jgi:hypothetical protein